MTADKNGAPSEDFQNLLTKADRYFEAENWAAALNYYQKAYDLKRSFGLNFALVKTLLALSEVNTAVKVAQEYEDLYIEDGSEKLQVYCNLLGDDHQFIAALRLLPNLTTKMLQQMTQTAIEAMMADYQQIASAKIERTIKASFELVNGTNEKNLAVIAELKRLPLSDYVVALRLVTTNTYIHPLYKAELLSFIAPLKVAETMPMQWFGEDKTVRLDKLPESHQTPALTAAVKEIQTQAHLDLFLEKTAVETLNLQFLLLYPFSDTVVTDPQAWAQVLLQQIQALSGVKTQNQGYTTLIQWQKRLSDLIDQLIY
ncbi:hypothetical protein ACFQ5M_03685 [Agrilactobacillus yilanensis]|uniref:Tetratricopeptide repeat protein n=1 Tax=Agrilactobacillus yilanensis TaxID=2485997 RepID=A0ABW4J6B2_9LACO|nr:hypothetical protein [Agrilactobacillus yilanensis]